jgi:sugar lactone lactonase YvrE
MSPTLKLSCIAVALALSACGGGGSGASTATPPPPPANVPTLTLLAGQPGGAGNVNGTAGRFTAPLAVAVDQNGNLVVSDGSGWNVRRTDLNGTISTIPKYSEACNRPYSGGCNAIAGGIAVGPDGTIFMAQSTGNSIERILPTGDSGVFVGDYFAGSADGGVLQARFNHPDSIAIDAQGKIFVADTGNGTIRVVMPDGTTTTLAGLAGELAVTDGTGAAARFAAPVGIARDQSGNLYVGDQNTIRQISPAGVVRTIAGSAGQAGSADGTGAAARFGKPSRLAVDKAGNVLVADSGNFTIRRVTPTGVVTTVTGIIGKGDDAGNARTQFVPGSTRDFGYLAIDKNDNLYFADTNNGTVRRMAPDGTLSTVAGVRAHAGKADGPANTALFNDSGTELAPGADGTPWLFNPMSVDSGGNVYVGSNHTIRKVAPDGIVSTLASQADPSLAGVITDIPNSTGATQEQAPYFPAALPLDGSVYAFDQRRLVKIAKDGSKTFIAGTTSAGAAKDGTGEAARFNAPEALTVDAAGNIYLVDRERQTCCQMHGIPYYLDGGWQAIRKVTPAGVVTTIAGCTTSAHCVSTIPVRIAGFAMDKHGNFYVTDDYSVRKITPDGKASLYAGTDGYVTTPVFRAASV